MKVNILELILILSLLLQATLQKKKFTMRVILSMNNNNLSINLFSQTKNFFLT